MNIIELSTALNLHVKIVTSIKEFDNYNSFFNIYGESEEPCRRILLLTPYKELEEVYDNNPNEKINGYRICDNNIWLKEYPLTTNPKNISLYEFEIDNYIADELIKNYKLDK